MYCDICSIFTLISVCHYLISCLICNVCITCSCWCACTTCSCYIYAYILVVGYICRLICEVFNKSKLSCSVKAFCTRCCRSCRCVKLCTSTHLIVVNCNISGILSSVNISYCDITSCRRIVSCMICRCCTYKLIVCESIRCCCIW